MEKQDKPFDNGAKRLLALCAQDFLDWLAPGAVFTGKLSEAFQSVSIDADIIHEASRSDDLELFHVEIQSTPDATMEQRLLEYNVLAYRRYKRFVNSYVIFLREGGEGLKPPLIRRKSNGEVGLLFDYKVILLRKYSYKTLLEEAPQGTWQLIPFTDGGAQREVVDEIITRLIPATDIVTKELLALTCLFASLAFTNKEDQLWVQRRQAMMNDFLREAPLYQHILLEGEQQGERRGEQRGLAQGLEQGLEQGLQKGREEGLEKGLTEGLEKGREEGLEKERQERVHSLRLKIVSLAQQRFPQQQYITDQLLSLVKQPEVLEDLFFQVAVAKTIDEAQNCLLAAIQQNNPANE